jgi:hypothetical protein
MRAWTVSLHLRGDEAAGTPAEVLTMREAGKVGGARWFFCSMDEAESEFLRQTRLGVYSVLRDSEPMGASRRLVPLARLIQSVIREEEIHD